MSADDWTQVLEPPLDSDDARQLMVPVLEALEYVDDAAGTNHRASAMAVVAALGSERDHLRDTLAAVRTIVDRS